MYRNEGMRPRRSNHSSSWTGAIDQVKNRTPIFRIGEYETRDHSINISQGRESKLSKKEKKKGVFKKCLNQVETYCDNTTLHGLKYVGDTSLTLGERIFWFIAFLLAIIFASYYISNIYKKWNSSPVIISFSPFDADLTKIPFPAITICNMNQAKRYEAEKILKEGSDVEKTILYGLCNSDNGTTVAKDETKWETLRDFLIRVGSSCENMLKLCKWRNEIVSCESAFNNDLTDEGLCCSFNRLPDNKIYRNTKDIGLLNRTYPEKVFDWSPENGFDEDETGEDDYIPRRPLAGSHLGLSIVLDAQVEEYYCSSTSSIGFKIILANPLETPKMADYGFLLSPGTETRFALVPSIREASDTLKNIEISKRQCYFEGERPLRYYRENMAIAHFFFTTTKFTKEIKSELYGFTEILSNVGGLLGLCMGFSLLSLIEFIYFVSLRVCYNNLKYIRRKEPKSNKKIKREQNNKVLKKCLNQFKSYCDNSTLHGLKYVGDTTLTLGERFFWFIAFVIAVLFAAYYIADIYKKWNSSPVIISFSPFDADLTNIPFPAITICNMNQVKRYEAEKILKEGSDVEKSILYDICNSEYLINVTNTETKWETLQDFLVRVGSSCENMLKLCKWRSEVVSCESTFNNDLTDDGLCCSFNRLPDNKIYRNLKDIGILNRTYPDKVFDWSPEHGFDEPETGNEDYIPRRPLGIIQKIHHKHLNIIILGAGSHLGLSIVLDAQLDEYYCSSTSSVGFKVLIGNPLETPSMGDYGFLLSPGTETRFAIVPTIREARNRHIRVCSSGANECVAKTKKNLEQINGNASGCHCHHGCNEMGFSSSKSIARLSNILIEKDSSFLGNYSM
ncbi:unnamed protein product [Brassicogethes aeneus]|uniref:Uncharacterized protein n=1 Tax=Brassicogethes aeneus TaxID=1431903 RepID=A0A9P0FJE6_BRAAE|nr:unnamed protein product [Brassicogethes aeneus]